MAITKKAKVKKGTTKATGRTRNYDYEYDTYHGKPSQIKKRAQRNSARSTMAKAGAVKKGDGKVVDHKKMIKDGGSNAKSNLRVASRSKNAGWRKGKKG